MTEQAGPISRSGIAAWSHLAGRLAAAVLLTCVGTGAAMAAPAAGGNATQDAPEAPRDDAAIANGLMISPRAAEKAKRAACETARSGGDIVVCGADHGEQWRVPSTSDSDPASHQAQNTGVPAAPNVSSLPDCRRGCVGFGRVPPPVYVVDFSLLPKAPAGSDADLIARGEIPAP